MDTLSTFNSNYELSWDSRLGSVSNYTFLGESPDGAYRVPLLTTKDVSWKNIVVEMLWFLSGDPHIEILRRHGCKFWDPWANEHGEVPMAYGEQWRRFPVHTRGFDGILAPDFNDQIKYALATLKRDPMSRRVVVSAWAPALAQNAALPPCHMLFVFNVQNVVTPDGVEPRLCMHLTQRSCDLALGVPYNMASYGLLLLIFSHLTGIKPGIFAHTLLDLHIYTSKPDGSMAEYDHVPGLKTQLERTPGQLPLLQIDPGLQSLEDIEALMRPEVTTEEILAKFRLTGYQPQAPIKFKVAV